MDQSVYLLRNENRLTKERVSIVTLKTLVSGSSNDFNSYPLEKITATFFQKDFPSRSLKILGQVKRLKVVPINSTSACVQVTDLSPSCFLQIFKSAEKLDLGCGVGGGKDNEDIFKVSKITYKLEIKDLEQEIDNLNKNSF